MKMESIGLIEVVDLYDAHQELLTLDETEPMKCLGDNVTIHRGIQPDGRHITIILNNREEVASCAIIYGW